MNLDVKDARTVEVLFGEPSSHSFWKGGPCAVQLKTFKIFCSSLTLYLQLYVKNGFTVDRKNIYSLFHFFTAGLTVSKIAYC